MRKILVVLAAFVLTGGLAWADGEVNPQGVTWEHNTEADLAGYYIYEAVTAEGQVIDGVNFAVSVPAGTNTWMFPVDHMLGSFYWTVTAYDTSGNESGPSNEVWAIFADVTPPDDPVGCSIIP